MPCRSNTGPFVRPYKYELPGDKQVKEQSLYVGQVKNGKLTKVEVEKWPGQLLQVLKTPDIADKVFFVRKKRTRDEFELCSADVKTGEVKVIRCVTMGRFILNRPIVYFKFYPYSFRSCLSEIKLTCWVKNKKKEINTIVRKIE